MMKKKFQGIDVVQLVKGKVGVFVEDAFGQLHGLLPIEKLMNQDNLPNVDADEYQRELRFNQVNNMAAHFEPFALKEIVVGLRADTSLWIIDGQQEVGALIKLGVKSVWCRIIPNCTAADEAKVFYYSDSRASLSANSRFRAGLRAGLEPHQKINGIVTKYGLKICLGRGRPSAGEQVIKPVGVLENLFHLGVLKEVLEVVTTSFRIGESAIDAYALKGQFLAALGDLFHDDPKLKVAELQRALTNHNAEDISILAQKKAMGMRRGQNSERAHIAKILQRYLNAA